VRPEIQRYAELLLEWNRSMNLTGARTMEQVDGLIGDAQTLTMISWSGITTVIDIGSGGGLPGIPLKIALPGLRMTLVESDQKKAAFLRDAVEALKLDDVVVDSRRAEEIGRDPEHRETYDVVVTRAAAKPPVTVEYCMPLLRVGGVMLAQARSEDFRSAARAVGQLGGRIRHERGGVVVIGKGRPTPDAFPRRVGVPGKRPL